MSSEPLLNLEQAAKSYPLVRRPIQHLWSQLTGTRSNQNVAYALHPLNLQIRRGETVGIVGLNGAGKSTLLQMAAGVVTPSSGRVHINGRVAALLELGSGFNPEASGRQNIFLYASTLGLSREATQARLAEIIAFSGLEASLDAPVKTYSTGMHVRLAFSVATSVEPDILIVDEALSVGDGVFAKRSFDRIMALRDQGTALLLCSHALFHIDQFCQQTLWLHQGKVSASGATKPVLLQYQDFIDSQAANASEVKAFQQATPTPELARMLRARVSLDGQAGTEQNGLSHQSTMVVEVDYQNSMTEPYPRAAVVISSDSGRIIGTSISPATQAIAPVSPARHTIRFDMSSIALNSGRYRVGVYLMCHQARYVYDWTDPHTYINLQHEGAHQGPWLLPGQWGVQP